LGEKTPDLRRVEKKNEQKPWRREKEPALHRKKKGKRGGCPIDPTNVVRIPRAGKEEPIGTTTPSKPAGKGKKNFSEQDPRRIRKNASTLTTPKGVWGTRTGKKRKGSRREGHLSKERYPLKPSKPFCRRGLPLRPPQRKGHSQRRKGRLPEEKKYPEEENGARVASPQGKKDILIEVKKRRPPRKQKKNPSGSRGKAPYPPSSP